jgi:tryptophan 2,3-dioxygenase
MSTRFGEEGRRLSYGSYLKISELLELQNKLSDEHDELLFIVAHQIYELWFKVVLFELEAARDRIDADDVFFALHYLKRVDVIEKLLVEQIDVLETMSPQDFLAFRSQLAPASGFQSVQFREIEFLSGLKEPRYLARLEATADETARLRRRLDEPSIGDAFHRLLERRGPPTLIEVFRDRERHSDLFDLCEALSDHDEAFAHWRARHVLMVERQIAARPAPAAAPARSISAARLGSVSTQICGKYARSCEGPVRWRASRTSHEEDARGEPPRDLRNVPDVRRHRVVPALELPHDSRISAMPVLQAKGELRPAGRQLQDP